MNIVLARIIKDLPNISSNIFEHYLSLNVASMSSMQMTVAMNNICARH
jgi:hypothetical protein